MPEAVSYTHLDVYKRQDHICLIAEEYQSMQNGLSSFGGEIMQLQNAIEQQKQGFGLLIFDELARGTNPDEGSAIVKAVVRYLRKKQVMAVLATHYLSLIHILRSPSRSQKSSSFMSVFSFQDQKLRSLCGSLNSSSFMQQLSFQGNDCGSADSYYRLFLFS